MAMDLGGAKGGVKSDINVTPLVDVMLVLLIIMMLVAPMLQQGISVTLPKATNTVDKPEVQDQAVLAIGADKRLYLNAKPIQEGELATKLNEFLENKKEKIVLIKADEEVEYGAVMAAMDQLRQAGIEDIGLITEPKLKPGAQAAEGSNGARTSAFRRRDGLQGRGPSRQRGHERHADDRRAARAPRHLHGGAAAHDEGARHQPAGRDQDRESADAGRQPDHARVRADKHISVNHRT